MATEHVADVAVPGSLFALIINPRHVIVTRKLDSNGTEIRVPGNSQSIFMQHSGLYRRSTPS
jgi:hypothetical protein